MDNQNFTCTLCNFTNEDPQRVITHLNGSNGIPYPKRQIGDYITFKLESQDKDTTGKITSIIFNLHMKDPAQKLNLHDPQFIYQVEVKRSGKAKRKYYIQPSRIQSVLDDPSKKPVNFEKALTVKKYLEELRNHPNFISFEWRHQLPE